MHYVDQPVLSEKYIDNLILWYLKLAHQLDIKNSIIYIDHLKIILKIIPNNFDYN